MNTMGNSQYAQRTRQAGTVLLVAVVLLLLASLMVFFAVRVTTFEQRTSGNDLRAKLVQQVADSALTQAAENVLANSAMLGLGTGNWSRCEVADTTFPCGVVGTPGATDITGRRATMFRFNAGTVDVFGDGTVDAMDQRMLPLDRRMTSVNNTSATATDGFAVNYGVGALLCRLAPAPVGTPATCSINAGDTIAVNALTMVAVAAIPGEGARATATKTFATNTTFPFGPNQPPIMASGSATLRGGLQVVTSPNGAGPGVPVSIWTRTRLDAGGTPDTCYQDEFFRSGTPVLYPSGAPREEQILRCDDCDCGLGQLTTGHGNSCSGGMDIVAAGSDCGPNRPLQPNEFPCDMFKHVFGVAAWRDTNADNFCETRIMVDDPANPTGPQIGADEKFLAEKADWIISATTSGFGARFAGDPRVIACNDLPGKAGLVWVRTGECGDGKTIGSPAAPVLLVHDGTPSMQNLKLFGLFFGRSVNSPLSSTTGGDAEFRINAGSAVYGAIIVQGIVDKANGHAIVVYDPKVLGNLSNSLSDPDVVGLPGSWSDLVRY